MAQSHCAKKNITFSFYFIYNIASKQLFRISFCKIHFHIHRIQQIYKSNHRPGVQHQDVRGYISLEQTLVITTNLNETMYELKSITEKHNTDHYTTIQSEHR